MKKTVSRPQVVVRSLSKRATRGRLVFGNVTFSCVMGRGGRSATKREGDGATPMGRWPIRGLLFRPDRSRRPRTALGVRALKVADGWCDAAGDRNYNRPVRHPYPASAERMWRDDELYDLVLVLGYNLRPRVQGRGSAIFLHIARPGFEPTAGCIALTPKDVKRMIALVRPGDVVRTDL